MVFAKEFFDLQLAFAEKVRELSGLSLERALLEYTNLYVRFGLGRDFDPDCETWQPYLAGVRGGENLREWTYRFYLEEPEARTAPAVAATSGCFSVALLGANQIRLHFRNAETSGRSPLGRACIGKRRADLSALFAQLRRTGQGDLQVVGVSWLYNLDAYRRLFPPVYVSSARELRGRFRSMSLWGQFVNRHGQVKDAMARPFLAALAQQSTFAGLDACFPLQILTVRARALEFYDFYSCG